VKLAIGTVQFGLNYGVANHSGQMTLEQAREVLALARLNGIADLDTAISYGDAEFRLGQIGVEGFRVITKLPALPSNTTDASNWIKSQLTASLRRLGCSSIYGLMLHKPADLLGPHGSALRHALQDLQEHGLVEKLGISIYGPMELEELMPLVPWGLVQAPFNLVDRRLERSGWLARLKEREVEVHTRSAFLQGLLLTPSSALPPKFSPWMGLWKKWQEWQCASPYSALSTCLAFVHSFPEVDRVVVGVDGPAHLQGILAAVAEPAPSIWPELASDDEQLINPSRWADL
jgi:aryl-alcohol dehydrogenase-like predicted oxidoreductase